MLANRAWRSPGVDISASGIGDPKTIKAVQSPETASGRSSPRFRKLDAAVQFCCYKKNRGRLRIEGEGESEK
jgi:hypothetical protein